MLICYEYDYTADADIGIDDVAEDAVGDMLENVGTQHRADDDTAEAIEIINCYSETTEDSLERTADSYGGLTETPFLSPR